MLIIKTVRMYIAELHHSLRSAEKPATPKPGDFMPGGGKGHDTNGTIDYTAFHKARSEAMVKIYMTPVK